jgi:integrase
VAQVQLPGAHRNIRRRAGRVIAYWQAWRGGPAIGKFEGATLADLERAERDGAPQLAEAYGAARRTEVPTDTLAGVVAAYKASPEYGRLAGSTLKQWNRWLDRIVEDLGTFPILALKAKGARRAIIDWRNRFAATPRTADYAVQVIRRVLSWAVDNELAEKNPALGIDELYHSDRSGEIVEPDELAAVLSKVSPAVSRYIRLAAATGLRRGDLSRLKWSDLTDASIEMATGKSRGRRRIIVPLFEDARIAIAECKAVQTERDPASTKSPIASVYVLTSRLGKPWSKDGPTGGWVKAAAACRPPITKHLHDLRGNFATLLMANGLSDEQIADMMGWSEVEDVSKIRRRYVDRDRVARGIVARLDAAMKNGQ